jgi:hypothetical protein
MAQAGIKQEPEVRTYYTSNKTLHPLIILWNSDGHPPAESARVLASCLPGRRPPARAAYPPSLALLISSTLFAPTSLTFAVNVTKKEYYSE